MMVNFEKETDLECDFDLVQVAEKVCRTVVVKEQVPKECEVELLLTDAETVRQINFEYRNIDKETDVLSFPNIDWDAPCNFDSEDFNSEFILNPENSKVMLGQIVLCKERILSQAEEYGHSVMREYAFLIAHSMLHLLGYDHMVPEEAAVMEQKQSDYLDELGIGRNA